MEQHPRTKAEMESAVAPTLERLGWTVEERSSAIASKQFQSIATTKVAHIYVADFGPREDSLVLTGTFFCGPLSNWLEPCMTSIPRTASMEEVSRLTEKFVLAAEKRISEEWGVRLFRQSQPAAAQPHTA